MTETKLPEGLEWVLGRINATRFINQDGGEGMTNEVKLLDTLEALLKDGVDWSDLEIAMRQRAESVLGIEPSKECSGCGATDDKVWCEDCFAQSDYHCSCCDLEPVCLSCGHDVTHPLCEDCLDVDVYTDLRNCNKDTAKWCGYCSASHPHGVCPDYWRAKLTA